jgi:Glutathione-dependent formaldehyde-activating enzyme
LSHWVEEADHEDRRKLPPWPITYEAEIDREKVMICHCADCQTLSGSAFPTVAFTREGTFKLLSGKLKIYIKTGESGTKRPQSFASKRLKGSLWPDRR